MAIVQTINTVYQFGAAFKEAGRGDQFSREGLEALFTWLEEYSEGTGEHVVLDVGALCCEFYEDDYSDIADNYNIDLSYADGDEDEEKQIVINYLQDNTYYVGEGADNSLVYQLF